MTENLSAETLPGAEANVPASDGGATVESSALTLADLNKQLNSNFKDVPTALKSLKDTKDFVGKRKEDAMAEIKASMASASPTETATKSDIQQLKNELFYSQNPEYKQYEGIISKLSADPAQAVSSEEFKGLFDKAKIADGVARNKSVVASNSRLSQNKTVLDTAINVANSRGTTGEDTAMIFARAINAQSDA